MMATIKEEDADGQWHGITGKVKKTVRHYDEMSSKRDKAITMKVEKAQEEVKEVK